MKLALVLLLLLAVGPFAFASSSSQRSHGAAVFDASGCRHCHTIGSVGGRRGPDLSDIGKRKSKAVIREQIVNGSKIMPAFRDVLKPDELSDLIEYLRSCRKAPSNSGSIARSN